MKKIIKILFAFFFLLLVGELFARYYLGLGNPPLYIEDNEFEYIYAPNQDVKRFGNKIVTNQFSMRSRPLSDKDEVRILKIGDSIINGGAQTDQDSLASSILENELSDEFAKNIRVFNVGANSWGPDNAFAYIKKYGHFGSSMIVLVFSSHDLYDKMHFQKVVGKHTTWPEKKPLCALTDGFFKYFIPYVKQKTIINYNEYSYLNSLNQVDEVNSGWKDFFNYVQEHQLELLVYLHPTKDELLNGAYDPNGKQLIALLEENQVNHIPGLALSLKEDCYRDYIHLNNKGQKKLAEALIVPLRNHITTKLILPSKHKNN